MYPQQVYPCFPPRRKAPLPSSSLNKLLATTHAVFVSTASADRVFLFTALLEGDILVHQLAARRAKAHRSIWTRVIEVQTTVLSPSHDPSLPAIATRSPVTSNHS